MKIITNEGTTIVGDVSGLEQLLRQHEDVTWITVEGENNYHDRNLEELPDFSGLKRLIEARFHNFPGLFNLPKMGPQVRGLVVSECSALIELGRNYGDGGESHQPPLHLKTLMIINSGLDLLRWVPPELVVLRLHNVRTPNTMGEVPATLEMLELFGCDFEDLPDLGHTSVTRLVLKKLPNVKHLRGLSPVLKVMWVQELGDELTALRGLPSSLEDVTIMDLEGLEEVEVEILQGVPRVAIMGCKKLKNPPPASEKWDQVRIFDLPLELGTFADSDAAPHTVLV